MQYNKLLKSVKGRISSSRYKHTLGVVETAVELAEIYGYDKEKARLAAALHDCAKSMSDDDKIKLCKNFGVSITNSEYRNPGLLHAKAGALVAEHEYGIMDFDIIHAIRVHTTGDVEMNLLDEIIFVADYIEPNRDRAPRLDELRKLAREDLQMAVFIIMEQTIDYLKMSNACAIDDTTMKAYEHYRAIIQSR